MSNVTSALNPNVVKTALDTVFMQEFNGRTHPGYVDATSPSVFKQDTIDRAAAIAETFRGTGLWEAKAEEADVKSGAVKVGNTQTFIVSEYAKSIDISKNFFDDEQHGVYEKMVRDMGETGRITRDMNAFGLYRGAFTTTLTADGKALVADDHVTQSGATIDNRIASNPVLAEASLNTGIIMMVEQKAEDGTVRGQMPEVLLVPPALFKLACEITESELRSGTANNDMNVYSVKYGITVATSPYLGAAAGGSDTAWFLLGRNHSVTRWVRQGIVTDLVDYKFQRNNNYIYKASFREALGAYNYTGVVGSTGLAA
jgi:phage major head subunit gpT-like protein